MKMFTIRLIFITLFMLCNSIAVTSFANTTCSTYFYKNAKPIIIKDSAELLITPLCLHGFSVGYSHVLRTPIWAAEYLTKQHLKIADGLTRDDQFHEESQLPKDSRVTLKEIKTYGYDRGHLAPHHDMADINAQYDSFSLANIVLQNRKHNRSHWATIERKTRYLVYKYDEAYVVTGISIKNANFSKKNILIPSYLFKAVYLPTLGKAGVFWSKNSATEDTQIISLAQLKDNTGLVVFPDLPENITNNAFKLKEISNNNFMSSPHHNKEQNNSHSASADLFATIKRFFVEVLTLIKNLFV